MKDTTELFPIWIQNISSSALNMQLHRGRLARLIMRGLKEIVTVCVCVCVCVCVWCVCVWCVCVWCVCDVCGVCVCVVCVWCVCMLCVCCVCGVCVWCVRVCGVCMWCVRVWCVCVVCVCVRPCPPYFKLWSPEVASRSYLKTTWRIFEHARQIGEFFMALKLRNKNWQLLLK